MRLLPYLFSPFPVFWAAAFSTDEVGAGFGCARSGDAAAIIPPFVFPTWDITTRRTVNTRFSAIPFPTLLFGMRRHTCLRMDLRFSVLFDIYCAAAWAWFGLRVRCPHLSHRLSVVSQRTPTLARTGVLRRLPSYAAVLPAWLFFFASAVNVAGRLRFLPPARQRLPYAVRARHPRAPCPAFLLASLLLSGFWQHLPFSLPHGPLFLDGGTGAAWTASAFQRMP